MCFQAGDFNEVVQRLQLDLYEPPVSQVPESSMQMVKKQLTFWRLDISIYNIPFYPSYVILKFSESLNFWVSLSESHNHHQVNKQRLITNAPYINESL